MWWTVAKIAGIASAILLSLAFLFILVMVTRPALLWGVSGESLGNSVLHSTSVVECVKRDDGDWNCDDRDSDERYRVDVDWMGCWEAVPVTDGTRRDGCVELGDIFVIN